MQIIPEPISLEKVIEAVALFGDDTFRVASWAWDATKVQHWDRDDRATVVLNWCAWQTELFAVNFETRSIRPSERCEAEMALIVIAAMPV